VLNQVDAEVIAFEMISSGAQDLEDVCREITDMKVAIGAIDHHTLQVESSQEIAALTASLGADPKLSLIRFNQ
jgi:methionine synthase II (cobalamin-independent)